ncbi:unnamed protein product, partial [Ixodes pacificus]
MDSQKSLLATIAGTLPLRSSQSSRMSMGFGTHAPRYIKQRQTEQSNGWCKPRKLHSTDRCFTIASSKDTELCLRRLFARVPEHPKFRDREDTCGTIFEKRTSCETLPAKT